MARSLAGSTQRPEIRLQSGPTLTDHPAADVCPHEEGPCITLTEESRYVLLGGRVSAEPFIHPPMVLAWRSCAN
jgi:hypothetical protein